MGKGKRNLDVEEEGLIASAFGKVLSSVRGCLGKFSSSKPPEPAAEVVELLQDMKITPRLVIHFHQIFKQLKQSDPITLRVGPNEVSTASMTRLVKNHRKWVAKILILLLDLAGYKDTVTWDGFIYVTMQFCSMSKLELCQVMFYIVSKEMKSWTVHYLTSSQLEEFYDDYYACPVQAFNTNSIDFAKLPLAKYRMQDYIELCYRRLAYGEHPASVRRTDRPVVTEEVKSVHGSYKNGQEALSRPPYVSTSTASVPHVPPRNPPNPPSKGVVKDPITKGSVRRMAEAPLGARGRDAAAPKRGTAASTKGAPPTSRSGPAPPKGAPPASRSGPAPPKSAPPASRSGPAPPKGAPPTARSGPAPPKGAPPTSRRLPGTSGPQPKSASAQRPSMVKQNNLKTIPNRRPAGKDGTPPAARLPGTSEPQPKSASAQRASMVKQNRPAGKDGTPPAARPSSASSAPAPGAKASYGSLIRKLL